METEQARPLARYLGPVDVWAMAFGTMVGWGVFAMPGTTFLPVAGPLGTAIALLIGMAVMLTIGSNFSYLMGRSSITGGVYSYTKEAFGRDHAFLSAWFLCLSYLTIVFLNGTALFFVVRILFAGRVHAGLHYTVAGSTIYLSETVVSVLALAGVGALFASAKPLLQKLHTVLSVILFLGVVITTLFCLPQAAVHGAFRDFGTTSVAPGYAIFSLVILAPWAFVGFETTAFDTAHINFAGSRMKRIIVLAIIGTAFAYISMNLISVAAVPEGFARWQAYIGGLDRMEGVASVPTFFAAESVMGTAGLVLMTLTALAAILTGLIGGYRATTRVLATMAEDHILSEKFLNTSYSIVFIMVISILLSMLGRNTLNWFVDLTSFGAIVGFGYTSAAAWKIARSEGQKRVRITGAVGTSISVLFVVVQLVPRLSALEAMGSEAYLLLSLWCLVGFIFYWRTVTQSTLAEYSGMSASGVVLFALLMYSALMWLAKRLSAGEMADSARRTLTFGGAVMMLIIFTGLVVMLYVQNVVRRKHEEAEREKIHAVESSLAKSRFLFNMSHDIRTPMNAIIGYTTLALREPSSDTVHSYLEKIDGSSHHLLDLINDILEMSRIESGKVEPEMAPMDLADTFAEMHTLFDEQMRQKGLDFQVHYGELRHPFVWCDRKNLNRALLNILGNAYKFTPGGGTVAASVLETGSAENGYASYEIRVRDSGIGMSKEFAERIFSAFERERTSTVSGLEGAGLGMSITKGIIDLLGGTIEVMTAPGAGTEFIIRLKLRTAEKREVARGAATGSAVSADVKARPEALTGDVQIRTGTATSDTKGHTENGAASAAEFDPSSKRLLLVEDNDINMEIASMILTDAGYQLDTAVNGQLALEKVRTSEPGYYDAVLMDIQMPVMDGYAATRAIRALSDETLACIPIIAMTANAFKEDEQAAFAAGMQAHIAKPIDVDVMLGTIRRVLEEYA